MSIRFVLGFKIVATLLMWVLPLLLAPGLLTRAGVPVGTESIIFLRLLGAAYLALLVAYCLAYRNVVRDRDIADTVRVGVVSNGLACLLLIYYGAMGYWAAWGALARAGMWGSAAVTGAITLALALVDYGPGAAGTADAASES